MKPNPRTRQIHTSPDAPERDRHRIAWGCCTRLMLHTTLALIFLTRPATAEFRIASAGRVAPIVVDDNEPPVVRTAAELLASDIEMVCGTRPVILNKLHSTNQTAIVVGTPGFSTTIKTLTNSGALDVARLTGLWESFMITRVRSHASNTSPQELLVLVGSDGRGAAYAAMELSRRIGMSPWYWWADVPVPKTNTIIIGITNLFDGPPAVKYRGLFINDEDWGLHPWAARHLDPEHGCIGPRTYERVFELMLRLRANLIWPAMHSCTKAFFSIPENPRIAHKYGIIIGSSHCEPMLRNNVYEWSQNFTNEYGHAPGPWDYRTNADQIRRYWSDRVRATTNQEVIYTIGMRGIHDSPMPGPRDTAGRIALLQQVIIDQREMLRAAYGRDPAQIPQMFCPYKEVLALYRGGLQLPDDVIICWSDDNHGYLRPMATPEEQRRPGSSGVYYHLSYWGAPADYLWLSTISPALIAYEMHRALAAKADKLWMFNVGDIKPAEWELTFAMELAWAPDKWHPTNAVRFIHRFASEIFGTNLAEEISQIRLGYHALALRGKPEHIDRIRFTEPELRARLDLCTTLQDRVEKLRPRVPEPLSDAFFQLVEYPVLGAVFLNKAHIHARLAVLDAARGELAAALAHARATSNAHAQIQELTRRYNSEIAGGKWNGIMHASPRNRPVFALPKLPEGFPTNVPPEAAPAPSRALRLELTKATLKPGRGVELVSVPGLGPESTALTLFPLTPTSESITPIELSNTAPAIKWVLPGLTNATVAVEVRTLPTQPPYPGQKLRYAIQLDDQPPLIRDTTFTDGSIQWQINVLRGFNSDVTEHHPEPHRPHTLTLYMIDPDVVLQEVVIEPRE